MNDKTPKKIEDVDFPTKEEMGFGTIDDGEGDPVTPPARQSLAEQQKEDTKEDPVEEGAAPIEDVPTGDAAPVYTETEQQAMQRGWTPKDQFKGDPAKWRSADVFLEHGELMDKISSSNNKIGQLQRAVEGVTSLVEQQAKRTVGKDKNDLLTRRRTAITDGDIEAVEAYDRQLQELDKPVINKEEIPAEAREFEFQNADWFNFDTADNTAMRSYAIAVESRLAKEFPNVAISQRLTKTKEMVVKKFPKHFGVKPPPVNYKATKARVEGASPPTNAKPKTVKYNDLPQHVKQIVHNVWIATNKKIDRDEYANKLVKSGAVEL